MRFSIEQVFLTDSTGRPLDGQQAVAHHVVDAETVDAALSFFLTEQQATVVGDIRRFPGAQAIAIAQQRGSVFTFHLEPGSNAFRQPRPRASTTDRVRSESGERDRAE